MIYGRDANLSDGRDRYIGAAVLDALVRGGHDVTALVRDNQKAARVAKRGGHPVDRQPRRSRVVPRGRRRAGWLHPHGIRFASSGGPAIDRAGARHDHRGGEASAHAGLERAGKAVRHLHSGVWVLGPAPEPAAEESPINPVAIVHGVPTTSSWCSTPDGDHLRTVVVRPGIVYGGGNGIVGDLFKSASNGLVRVIGDGNNHWPLVYDRDLGGPLCAAGRAVTTPRASITRTTKATSASTTSSRRSNRICR